MLPWIVSSAAKGEYMEARTPAVRKLWGGRFKTIFKDDMHKSES